MSIRLAKKSGSFTSMPSARKKTGRTLATPQRLDASLTKYAPGQVLSRPSSSPLADLYRTEGFGNQWANDVKFHVSRNIFHLRRFRRMSQSAVATAMKTSQSAIARMESAQENITLETLERLIAALRGRLYISISPKEHSFHQDPPWWELIEPTGDNNSWQVVRIAARRSTDTEQMLIGMERALPRTSMFLSASTS